MLIECEDVNEFAEENEEILLEPKGGVGKDLELFLHAMEGSSSPRTIRLLGHVNKKLVSILLDTGSTHNFIDPRVVQRTGLQVSPE